MKKTFILVLCLSMFIGQRSVLAKPMEIEEKLFQETLQQSKNVIESTDRRIWESHYRRHDIGERNHARGYFRY